MFDAFGLSLEPPNRPHLYTIAADVEPLSSVKVEGSDDRFIQDVTHRVSSSPPAPFAHLVPPTEVPLRATGVSKEMRKLMSVFRLNPFTLHNGGRPGASDSLWNGEEAGPLTEEPRYIEYQLDGFYDGETSDFGSHGNSASSGPSSPMLDGAKGSAGSDKISESSSTWQAAVWGLHTSQPSRGDTSEILEPDYSGTTSIHYSHTGSSYQNAPAPCSHIDYYSSFTRPLILSPPHSSWPTNTNVPFADYDRNTVSAPNEDSFGHSSPHRRQGQPDPSVLPPSMAGDVQQIWGPRPMYAFDQSVRDQDMTYRSSIGDTGLYF
ncbi:hypothetical protein HWV62_20966 [Athelia sp. TMB]|nr:hypothetical protein HWV62_20966 [Athelia sp. TMB]